MKAPFSPFVEHLLDLLSPWAEVHAKRMFGGYGIYREGLMFGLVAEDVLYLKLDDENRAVFADEGLGPFEFEMKSGKVATMSYYEIPESALSSPMRMRPWAESGWGAAQRADLKKAPQSRKRKRGL